MKFGKQLVKASMVSVQLCEPQLWLDYKKLKKFLKNIEPSNGQEISHSVDERKFFTLLKSELAKVSKTFNRLELKVAEKTKTLNALSVTDEDYLSRRLQLMTSLHLSLILLESYAVLNHVGFRKILKKHDKLTGFSTTKKYMEKVVAQEMFSDHSWIRDALFALEEEFALMKKEMRVNTDDNANTNANTNGNGNDNGNINGKGMDLDTAEVESKKRKREEKADFIKHQKEYLQEFAHHQQQYESMEMTTIGYMKQKQKKQKRKQKQQQQQKQKQKQKQKLNQEKEIYMHKDTNAEEKTSQLPANPLPTVNGDGDFENRKKQAQVALESLAMAAEAHLLL